MIEKQQRQSATTQCPVCHARGASGKHVAGCGTAAGKQVVEVIPPERPQKRPLQSPTVEAEFFPLVSAAHEFKTPLVVMLGYTDLLRTGQLGAINSKQEQVLGEIQESTQRLQKLIRDLLLLCELRSKDKPGARQVRLEVVDVNEEIGGIFNYWAAAAKQKSLGYQFRKAAGAPRVQVDSLKLQHIVSNLIENALKFTPAGGEVAVSVSSCFWERRKAQSEFLFNMERKRNVKIENAVRIDVSDSGPGISPEHHHDIFGDFVQLPSGSSRGTGLGLAIARRLVEGNGGLIWVESEPGKGSKFSILLAQARSGEITQ